MSRFRALAGRGLAFAGVGVPLPPPAGSRPAGPLAGPVPLPSGCRRARLRPWPRTRRLAARRRCGPCSRPPGCPVGGLFRRPATLPWPRAFRACGGPVRPLCGLVRRRPLPFDLAGLETRQKRLEGVRKEVLPDLATLPGWTGVFAQIGILLYKCHVMIRYTDMICVTIRLRPAPTSFFETADGRWNQRKAAEGCGGGVCVCF